MNDAELAAVSDGRVFTGRMGLPLKLVDQLGGERDAIEWLEKEKGITKDLAVDAYKPEQRFSFLKLFSSAAGLADLAGMTELASLLRKEEAASQAGALDGLMSIWHVGKV